MLLALLLGLSGAAADAQHATSIVGSSTISPYAEIVKRELELDPERQIAIEIVSIGSNAGFQALCAEQPSGRPSVAMASRRFSGAELAECSERIGSPVNEVELGANGVALVTYRNGDMRGAEVSSTDLFLALSAEVPVSEENCELVPNPHQRWSDVNSALPDVPISVTGPSKHSGTRSIFEKGALAKGAKQHPCASSWEASRPGTISRLSKSVRTDGAWIEVGEDDVELVAHLHEDKAAIGVIGYVSTIRFGRHLKTLALDQVQPTTETLATGAYSMSSKLYLYVNNEQLTDDQAATQFVEQFTSEEAVGDNGFLVKRGLIPTR